MAKLLIFGAFERVIFDEANRPSLIQLVSKVEAKIPRGVTMPLDALVPLDWTVYSLWEPEEGDFSRGAVQQVTQIVRPTGELSEHPSIVEFAFERGKNHQNRVHLLGFPTGIAGDLVVNVWLETPGHEKLTAVYSWRIVVEHHLIESPAASPATAL